MQQRVRIGLIGTGFMGKAHALAWRNVGAIFGASLGDLPQVELACLVDTPLEKAKAMADQFGFGTALGQWRALVEDPQIDVISITTPNGLHREIAEAALAQGKHVWCEKPMALTMQEARSMAAAAQSAGRKTLLGYNYLRNPAFDHACHLLADGAIGQPLHFRGWVDEDYQADPALPWTWRATRAQGGLGALGDIGCHLVSLAIALLGPIERLQAQMQTLYPTRPREGASSAAVENEDAAAALIRFASGVQGTMVISRAAWGRKSRLGFELHGSKGMIIFDQERMNELQLYQNDGPLAQQGFKTILTGPAHPPYGAFCPAPGHQLGFNDLKTIECARFLQAIAGIAPCWPDFQQGLEIEAIIHAMAESAEADGAARFPMEWVRE